ncbi:MAG: hypothetical protein KME20_15445 [Kaiparowitsia implicata GSE-PSE-MK54-09C]|jgi:hypothetical protein|nr:hypothetical protein [Kaiparowitsia implicata GSE-PSE-MK54-09C]
MAGTVEQIEQDIARLEQAIEAIAQEFEQHYRGYLTDLGQALSRQLISAVFHICTQDYPDRFLALTLAQRQDLQQQVRALVTRSQAILLAGLQPLPFAEDEPLSTDADAEISADGDEPSYESRSASGMASTLSASETLSSAASEERSPLVESFTVVPQPEIKAEQNDEFRLEMGLDASDFLTAEEAEVRGGIPPTAEASAAAVAFEMVSQLMDAAEPEQPTCLDRLTAWQSRVEASVAAEMQALSQAANQLLQQVQILPNRLIEPILDIAAQSGGMAEPIASPPNLMQLTLEAKPGKGKKSNVLKIVVVRLRLSEIEFGNAELGRWRSHLRTLNGKLSKLSRDYRRKRNAWAIAQAELAWRASWYDE